MRADAFSAAHPMEGEPSVPWCKVEDEGVK